MVPCVTLTNSGPNKLADSLSLIPEWVEVIVAGMVFKKSRQWRGATGDGSAIDKHVTQADRDVKGRLYYAVVMYYIQLTC